VTEGLLFFCVAMLTASGFNLARCVRNNTVMIGALRDRIERLEPRDMTVR
jgi:hypothetical protein